MQIFIIFSCSLLVGALIAYLLQKGQDYQLIKQSRIEADDILNDTKQAEEEKHLALKEGLEQEHEQKMAELDEKFADRWIEVNTAKKENAAVEAELKAKLDDAYSEFNDQRDEIKKQENRVKKIEDKIRQKRQHAGELRKKLVQNIETQFELNGGQMCQDMSNELEREYVRNTNMRIKADMEWLNEEADNEAKKIIMVAINRFSREYCGERGLSAVTIPKEELAQKVQGEFLEELQKLCGVDLIMDEHLRSVAVAGFDPVRRELARRVLIQVMKSGQVPKKLGDLYKKCRKDLFTQIEKDGNRIAKELKLKNLSPEIRKMMGCLRYRYSFSQNQYFHCSEAGWLCGLLASELSLDISEARRSGMLHDIGKSMDHSIEGGHAVIGADFIEKNGESEQIVHNVRAHHFDVQPDTDVAFLVIGADALSGGRPGARRSTIDSYNQKILELETIGNSHEGVISTYIVHGGREVRIIADGQKVDDIGAVKMSREIAKEIEETCNYPGQIKVVVVRESVATMDTVGIG